MVALAGYYRIDFCDLYFADCLGEKGTGAPVYLRHPVLFRVLSLQCKNKKPVARTGLFFLVAGAGFEPTTFRL